MLLGLLSCCFLRYCLVLELNSSRQNKGRRRSPSAPPLAVSRVCCPSPDSCAITGAHQWVGDWCSGCGATKDAFGTVRARTGASTALGSNASCGSSHVRNERRAPPQATAVGRNNLASRYAPRIPEFIPLPGRRPVVVQGTTVAGTQEAAVVVISATVVVESIPVISAATARAV